MIKKMEKADGRSCWNKAGEDELVFVLLARDPAAPAAIQAWIEERVRLRKNKPGDQQLRDAERAADVMADYSKQVAAGRSPCIVCGFHNAQVCQTIGHTYPVKR